MNKIKKIIYNYKNHDKYFVIPQILFYTIIFSLILNSMKILKISIFYDKYNDPHDISIHLSFIIFFGFLLFIHLFLKKIPWLKWFYLYMIYVFIVLFNTMTIERIHPLVPIVSCNQSNMTECKHK